MQFCSVKNRTQVSVKRRICHGVEAPDVLRGRRFLKTGEHFAVNEWPGHSIRSGQMLWPRHLRHGEHNLTPGEEAQLAQTIEMFEVITESQPHDYQSLEILKEAYSKLGREKDVVKTSKRIAEAYVQMGQLSSAILEYETILQRCPDDPDVHKALKQIESKANNFADETMLAEPAAAKPSRHEPLKTDQDARQSRRGADGGGRTPGDAQSFCRQQNHHCRRFRSVLDHAGSVGAAERRGRTVHPDPGGQRHLAGGKVAEDSHRQDRASPFCRWKNTTSTSTWRAAFRRKSAGAGACCRSTA